MKSLLLFFFISALFSCAPRMVALPASYIQQNHNFFTKVSDSVYVGRNYVYYKQKHGFYPRKITGKEAYVSAR